MSDKFKKVGPLFEFFRDGEQLRIKKLGTIVDKIQDGMDQLEAAVGDIHNRAITFVTNPLFQNSVGRSIGPVDSLTIQAFKRFELKNKIKNSLHQGLVRWPWSDAAAASAGNQSLNLIPTISQADKLGVGCINDDSQKCTARYDHIYTREKTIVKNGLFETQLSGWETSNATFNDGANLSIRHTYNFLPTSEDMTTWSVTGGGTITERQPLDPNGQSSAVTLNVTDTGAGRLDIALSGSGADTSTDWTFSIYMASSGQRDVHLEIDGATPTAVDGTPGGGATLDEYYTVTISGVEWKRYYVHNTYDSAQAASSLVARVNLTLGDPLEDEAVFLFGGQLEPEKSPTDYRSTTGTVVSGQVQEVSISQTVPSVGGHTYQVTAHGTFGGDVRLVTDGNEQTMTGGEDILEFTPLGEETTIQIYASGTSNVTNTLTQLRVDPGTPCHAMNCPGFSAYHKVREYRGVLPPITISGHQNFTDRLQLPDEFRTGLQDDLPGNILGLFDSELNRAVPKTIIDWRTANWPIGGFPLGGLVSDPDFLDSFIAGVPNSFDAFTSGAGGAVSQGTTPTSVTLQTILDDLPYGRGFAGSSDNFYYISGAIDAGIIIDDDFTLELWMKTSGNPASVQGLVSKGNYASSVEQANYVINLSTEGRIGLNIHKGIGVGGGAGELNVGWLDSDPEGAPDNTVTGQYYRASSPVVTDNEWHHVAVTAIKRGGGTLATADMAHLWVDGEYVDSGVCVRVGADPDVFETWNWFLNQGTFTALTHLGARRGSVPGSADGEFSGMMRGVLWTKGRKYDDFVGEGLSFDPPAVLIPSGSSEVLWPDNITSDNGGLYGFVPMEEGAGTSMHEMVSGYLAELDTSPTLINGTEEFWNLRFNAVSDNQAVSFTEYAQAYAVTGDFTLETWIWVSGDTGGDKSQTVINRSDGLHNDINYLLQTDTDGTLIFRMAGATSGSLTINSTATSNNEATSTDLGDADWHHVAVTVEDIGDNQPMARLWVDGTAEASGFSDDAWDWGLHDTLQSGAIVTLGQVDSATTTDNLRKVRQLMIVSGTRYTTGFTPVATVRTEGQTTFASFSINEGLGHGIYDRGFELRPPLLMENPTAGPTWESSFTRNTAVVTEGPTDVAVACAPSGSAAGLEKLFLLKENQVVTWTYQLNGYLPHSGVFAQMEVHSGLGQVDFELDGTWETGDPQATFNYRVSGDQFPGESAWATEANQYWTVRHRVRALESQTFMTLRVYVEGEDPSADHCINFESFDVEELSSSSTKFRYCGAPVLGLNFEGLARHVMDENLLPWSEQPTFWNSNTITSYSVNREDPSGLSTAVAFGTSGLHVGYQWDALDPIIKDSTLTAEVWARADNATSTNSSAKLSFEQDTYSVESNMDVTTSWQKFSLWASGIDPLMANALTFKITVQDPGTELQIAWPQVHHGSGVTSYVPTKASPIERYRKSLRLDQQAQLKDLDAMYALVQSVPIQTNLVVDSADGESFVGVVNVDFANFPSSGVINVAGQEFSYKSKDSTVGGFLECQPGWRGTNFNVANLVSGRRVTNVPLPQPVTKTEGDLIFFDNVIPVADGDWTNLVTTQLYNTQIENLDRWSMTASAVPVTRAVGSLMTSFVRHVADHRRHFRRSQICSNIVDPGNCASFDDLEIRVTINNSTVAELDQEAVIDVFAFGFMAPTNKKVTVLWGNGNSTVINGTGQLFETIPFVYDLGPIATNVTYTITVTVEDLDLQISRTGFVQVTVTPTTKATQTARAVVLTQGEKTQTAGATVKASISAVQGTRAYIST